MKVPAATAVPITPATFGPIACISRKFVGSASAPTFWDTRAAIGTADTPAEPISGLILPWVALHSTFPNRTPPAVPNTNAIRPRATIFKVLTFKNNYDVHHGIGSCLLELFYNAALTEQVTKHQHTYQRSGRWKDHADNDGDNNREQDLLEFGYGTKLLHFDFTLFLCSQKLHDRRLDDRHQ